MSVGSWVLEPDRLGRRPGRGAGPRGGRAGAPGRRGRTRGRHLGGVPLSGYTAVLLNNTVVPGLGAAPPRARPLLRGLRGDGRLVAARPAPRSTPSRTVSCAASGWLARAGRTWPRGGRWSARPARGPPAWRGPTGRACRAPSGAPRPASPRGSASRCCRAHAAPGPWPGSAGAAGSLAARYAVFHAGRASAADPRATFELQRASRHGGLSGPSAGVVEDDAQGCRRPGAKRGSRRGAASTR